MLSGAVALMWSRMPALARNITQTKAILNQTAVDTAGHVRRYRREQQHVGRGKLDAFAGESQPGLPPPPPPPHRLRLPAATAASASAPPPPPPPRLRLRPRRRPAVACQRDRPQAEHGEGTDPGTALPSRHDAQGSLPARRPRARPEPTGRRGTRGQLQGQPASRPQVTNEPGRPPTGRAPRLRSCDQPQVGDSCAKLPLYEAAQVTTEGSRAAVAPSAGSRRSLRLRRPRRLRMRRRCS